MPVSFYPHDEDVQNGSIQEKLEILMEAAERFKAAVLDAGSIVIVKESKDPDASGKKRLTPREIVAAYNWQEIAKILREIRELPETTPTAKASKSERLRRLAEIYEVLRGAKMPKLEAVRIALMNESTQLRGGGTQVA